MGEPLQSQLVITSHAHKGSTPITLSEIKIVFEGNLRGIRIEHKAPDYLRSQDPLEPRSEVIEVNFSNSVNSADLNSPAGNIASLVGNADLTFPPGQVKAFNLTSIPREAGEVKLASATMSIEEDCFSFACVLTHQGEDHLGAWWVKAHSGASRRRFGKDRDVASVQISPKPPKLQLRILEPESIYYTGERVSLAIELCNEEDEATKISLSVRLLGRADDGPILSWFDMKSSRSGFAESESESKSESMPGPATGNPAFLANRIISRLDPSSVILHTVSLTDTVDALDYELEVTATYSVLSDPDTPITKQITTDLSFIRPFEANYDFQPRLHTDAWPNFFEYSPDADLEDLKPMGITQKWNLSSNVVSFAHEALEIEAVELLLHAISGGAVCNITALNPAPAPLSLLPQASHHSSFTLLIQKLIYDDRRAAGLDLELAITWRRGLPYSSSNHTKSPASIVPAAKQTSILPIQRLTIPTSEPRVLMSSPTSSLLPNTTSESSSINLAGLTSLHYTLENPSLHFLTFNLTMEASDDFAFSGPKTCVIQLTPLSRRTVVYTLLVDVDVKPAASSTTSSSPSPSTTSKRESTASYRSSSVIGEVRRESSTGAIRKSKEVKGIWIRPNLIVVDAYFNKVLKPLAAGEDAMGDVGPSNAGSGKRGSVEGTSARDSGGGSIDARETNLTTNKEEMERRHRLQRVRSDGRSLLVWAE